MTNKTMVTPTGFGHGSRGRVLTTTYGRSPTVALR